MFNFHSNKKSHLEELLQKRGTRSKEEVIDNLIKKGFQSKYTALFIEFLSNYLPVDNFPIESTDDILKEYKINPEDLGDFYRDLFYANGIRIPNRKQQDEFFGGRLDYPVSLAIEFMIWCEKQSWE